MIKERYIKNIDEHFFTSELQMELLNKTVSVIGCGGVGGYILNFLSRLGVKKLIFWDGDSFSQSNLNRQTGAFISTLNKNKALSMKGQIKNINPFIEVVCNDWFFGEHDEDINNLMESDFIFMGADCSQNIENVRNLMRTALLSGIPVIDCPVTIYGGTIYLSTKNSYYNFDILTQSMIQQKNEQELTKCSLPAYKCAIVAGTAVGLMVKYFSKKSFQTHINLYI